VNGGVEPVFIVTSATIANPREHAADLVGEVCGRGLLSSTFQPNVSALCDIGDTCRGCLRCV